MKTENTTVYLRDYQPHPYRIVETTMVLDLEPQQTRVHTTHRIERRSQVLSPLILDCENIDIESVALDGQTLDKTAYQIDANHLRIETQADGFVLDIVNTLDPSANTQLSGLYQSGTMLCTKKAGKFSDS